MDHVAEIRRGGGGPMDALVAEGVYFIPDPLRNWQPVLQGVEKRGNVISFLLSKN